MARRLICAAALCVGSLAWAQDAGTDILPEALKTFGTRLSTAHSSSCTYVEKSTVEQLDSDKKVTAREVHTYRVEQTGREVKRTFVSAEKKLGELTSRLRPKQDNELSKDELERRRNLRSPFHMEEQAKYRFRWVQPPSKGTGLIAFEPLERDVKNTVGVATADVESHSSLLILSRPSDFPTGLSELDAKTNYANTPCGLRPIRFEVSGEGGILFLRVRFHSVTVFEGHAAP